MNPGQFCEIDEYVPRKIVHAYRLRRVNILRDDYCIRIYPPWDTFCTKCTSIYWTPSATSKYVDNATHSIYH